ncbi:MAG: glycosyltransferase family 39 protein, partial [Candidatus Melainabacteria bacterium]|nr:glycosyltransferase family 39 protein [Candidatus Melainabacteria bacterium]
MSQTATNKIQSGSTVSVGAHILYPALIFAVWLVTYIICRFVFPHMLGWDEMAYLSVARGIAEDFDFGGRSYTVMGLLKYGYPSSLINFPVYPIYLALFFKLFGSTQMIAYFATWLAALGVCFLIYFIFLKLVPNNHKAAFIVSLSYLFFPTILKNCDTAMMEQAGCFLLCLLTLFLIQEFEKGEFNFLSVLKISFMLLILWLYKILFIGLIFGTAVFIVLSYKFNKSKLPLTVFLASVYGLFAVLYLLVQKFIFYPVAPMVNFHPSQESKQVYADFLGGLFNNFPEHVISNISAFLKVVIGSYFLYPSVYY